MLNECITVVVNFCLFFLGIFRDVVEYNLELIYVYEIGVFIRWGEIAIKDGIWFNLDR